MPSTRSQTKKLNPASMDPNAAAVQPKPPNLSNRLLNRLPNGPLSGLCPQRMLNLDQNQKRCDSMMPYQPKEVVIEVALVVTIIVHHRAYWDSIRTILLAMVTAKIMATATHLITVGTIRCYRLGIIQASIRLGLHHSQTSNTVLRTIINQSGIANHPQTQLIRLMVIWVWMKRQIMCRASVRSAPNRVNYSFVIAGYS